MQIRPYRAEDRARVREIAYATGYMGESPAWYWRDAESFAEIWTGWYTDHEPESTFVADDGGDVVGYLAGCVDTARAPSPREASCARSCAASSSSAPAPPASSGARSSTR
jgi:hypothetical protein